MSLISKIKSFLNVGHQKLESQTAQDYSVKVVGYSPYTIKAFNAEVPLVFDKLDDTTAAACCYNILNKKVEYLALNIKHPELWTSSLEHESVHFDQFTHPSKPYGLLYDPLSFVAESRLLEAEAYTRQALKTAYDYKQGVIDTLDFSNNALMAPMAYMIGFATKTNALNGTKEIKNAFDNLRNQEYMPDEKTLVTATMYNLVMNKDFVKIITPAIIANLSFINDSIGEYKQISAAHGEEKAYAETSFSPDSSYFSRQLNLTEVEATLGRNNVNYFDDVNIANRFKLLGNLKSFSGAELKKIKSATSHIDFKL